MVCSCPSVFGLINIILIHTNENNETDQELITLYYMEIFKISLPSPGKTCQRVEHIPTIVCFCGATLSLSLRHVSYKL